MKAYEDILEKAKQVRENAYAPYSKFRVGACVKTKDGKYFMGANVENASYSLTNCAERTALFEAYSHGYRKEDIKAIAVYGGSDKLISPCGACRQVMTELLCSDTPIILATEDKILLTNIEELLPLQFDAENLK